MSGRGCGCLHVRSFFRLPPFGSSGPVVPSPVITRAVLSLCVSVFRGSVHFVTRVPFGSLPSNGFTDFEEFGPRGDGLLSALEICPMCGNCHVHRDDGTQLTLGTHGCIFWSRRLRSCLSSRVFEPALAAFSLCCSPIMPQVRLVSCLFRVVQRFGLDGCPKRDMLTSQGRGCFCFSAELALLLTLHLVDHLLEPESEGHVSFSGVTM